jgi:opacity protein-like surface antigen
MRGILKATLASLVLTAAAAPLAFAAAQAKAPAGPAENWASAFIVGYTGIGTFNNPVGTDALNQNETWNVGSGLGLGVSAAHVLGQALQIGAEATFAPSIGVEIQEPTATSVVSGHAKVGTAMATGRLMTGGGGGLGFFLQGGVGAVYWGMPAPATTATDFAYRYGGGLEYQTSMRRAIFLQWGQIGAFHKHHGVSSNTVKFSQITGGIRIGL